MSVNIIQQFTCNNNESRGELCVLWEMFVFFYNIFMSAKRNWGIMENFWKQMCGNSSYLSLNWFYPFYHVIWACSTSLHQICLFWHSADPRVPALLSVYILRWACTLENFLLFIILSFPQNKFNHWWVVAPSKEALLSQQTVSLK